MNAMNRKEFLRNIASFVFSFGTLQWIVSCGNNSDDPSGGNSDGPVPKPDCLNAGTNSSIGNNHGHTLTVSKEDVAAAATKTYNITGSSGHSHSVTLTTSHFQNLANNQSIQVSSSSGSGHTHSVTVQCALA